METASHGTNDKKHPYGPACRLYGPDGRQIDYWQGGMGEDSLAAFKKYKQAYLQAAPGCAVVWDQDVKNVHWYENGMPEAMWVLEADKFRTLCCNYGL